MWQRDTLPRELLRNLVLILIITLLAIAGYF